MEMRSRWVGVEVNLRQEISSGRRADLRHVIGPGNASHISSHMHGQFAHHHLEALVAGETDSRILTAVKFNSRVTFPQASAVSLRTPFLQAERASWGDS